MIDATKSSSRLSSKVKASSRLRVGITGSSLPQLEESLGQRSALDHLWLKYSVSRPKRKEPELESLEKTAERLYANGFCRPYLEPSKIRLKFRRKKHRSVLPVTDLWGDTQNKRLLIEIGLLTPRAAYSNRASLTAGTLHCQSTPKPFTSRVIRSNIESPTAVKARSKRKSSRLKSEGITLRLDKVMADCMQEKETVRQFLRSMTNYSAANHNFSEVRTPKGKLRQRELSKISYLMKAL
jgi:hypothetical protein